MKKAKMSTDKALMKEIIQVRMTNLINKSLFYDVGLLKAKGFISVVGLFRELRILVVIQAFILSVFEEFLI